MANYPLEGLLRPPVELWSSGSILFVACLCVVFPEFFFLSTSWRWVVGSLLVAFSTYRGYQAFRLIHYQRRLSVHNYWRISTVNMPRREGKLFLGKGFLWTQKHTQRLKETESTHGQALLNEKLNPLWLPRPLSVLNQKSQEEFSGRPEIHNVEMKDSLVFMNLSDRVGHTLVLGTTRVGKTRLAELLISQDIHRNEVVIVFDPKGDIGLLRRIVAEADRANRLQDLNVFHLGYPHLSCRYNPIGRFTRITEVATRIANQLPSEGEAAAFREFAWRFVNVIARALAQLRITPTYRLIRRYINDIEPLFVDYARLFLDRHAPKGWSREIRQSLISLTKGSSSKSLRGRDPNAVAHLQYLQNMDITDPVMEGLISALKYDRTYFDKIVSSVGPLMEKLTTGPIADLLSPNPAKAEDPRPEFDWLNLIGANGILYIGLDSLTDTTVASAIGNSMFADLVSVAGELYKTGGIKNDGHSDADSRVINIHADEFNELIGDEFVPLLNKAGGAGFQVTAYTQTWSDVEARIGSKAKSGQVAGNFNTLIMLRVRELATAEMLTKQLPMVSVSSITGSSGVSDSTKQDSDIDFTSKNDDKITKSRASLVSPSDLFALPRGHAFALLDGGHLWKIQLPLADEDDGYGSDTESLLAQLIEHRQGEKKAGG